LLQAARRAQAGASEAALDLLQDTLAEAREEGASSRAVVAILGQLADVLRADDDGDAVEAADVDRLRIELAKDAFGDASPELIEILVDVIRGRRQGADEVDAALADENLELAHEVVRASAALHGEDPGDARALPAQLVLAACLADVGRGEEADLVYRTAVELALETAGPARVETAVVLHNRAVHLLRGLGRVHEARSCFASSIEARRAAGDDVGAWAALLGLAEADRAAGDDESARDHASEALTLCERAFGARSSRAAAASNVLAQIMRAAGDDAAADELIARYLDEPDA
jgi:tetratricopeptide (TPR) repeat protein